MKAYLIRRFLLIFPTFLGISLITFLIIQLSPGNPIMLKLQAAQGAMATNQVSDQVIEQTKKLYGLDKPIHQQYLLWLGRLATLDFGNSYKDHRPVLKKIGECIWITLQINIVALFTIYLIAIPVGVYSATHQYSRLDNATTLGMFLLYSLPSFWVAMLLMYFLGGGGGSHSLSALCASAFGAVGVAEWAPVQWLQTRVLHFQWFPIHGFGTVGADEWPWYRWLGDRAWHLALPVFCLTYAGFAATSRYMRAGMIEEVRKDYIRTARAYGFSENTVTYKYAMRNALIPIATMLGEDLPLLIGGSVIIEKIYSIPGMGYLAFESILSRDYPLVMGILSITALLTLAGLIMSDILYALIDPRIKFE